MNRRIAVHICRIRRDGAESNRNAKGIHQRYQPAGIVRIIRITEGDGRDLVLASIDQSADTGMIARAVNDRIAGSKPIGISQFQLRTAQHAVCVRFKTVVDRQITSNRSIRQPVVDHIAGFKAMIRQINLVGRAVDIRRTPRCPRNRNKRFFLIRVKEPETLFAAAGFGERKPADQLPIQQ